MSSEEENSSGNRRSSRKRKIRSDENYEYSKSKKRRANESDDELEKKFEKLHASENKPVRNAKIQQQQQRKPDEMAKILSWRWGYNKVKGPLTSPNQAIRQREYFIKWRNESYWRCEWVPEKQMNIKGTLYIHFVRKNDMDVPPPPLDYQLDEKESRYNNLADKYYKYGVKPEWLVVQRVINYRKYKNGRTSYLVKWQDLPYEEATWEKEEDDLPGFKRAIEFYHDHRAYNLGIKKPENKKKGLSRSKYDVDNGSGVRKFTAPPDRPQTDLRKEWDRQPEYFDEIGLQLHQYQIEGINWLRNSYAKGIDTILADEMGLGKTIQTAAFLYSLFKEGHCKGPFLISVPLSTLINWERELKIWAPDLYVVAYTGDANSRIVIRDHELTFEEDAVPRHSKKAFKLPTSNVKFNVLLTSYELIRSDKLCLSSIDWKVLVVDEAHCLKSTMTRTFNVLSTYNIDYKLLLTGTPLQNNLEEMYNLLSFLCPEKFNIDFKELSDEKKIETLQEILGPHMMRRLKSDVLKDMPPKSEIIVHVELSPLQKVYHKYVITNNYKALNSTNASGKGRGMLSQFMNLKKLCNHPYLFANAQAEAPQTKSGTYEYHALVKAAGKLVWLDEKLKELKREGHRVLIFSQMKIMLDLLEDFLDGAGHEYERIDGDITGSLRQEAIDRFNAPGATQFVFLLTTRAGGLGINLATADTVIIYDSDWNPHMDLQALSRAHRIGQTREVTIYRLVTRNSVEEKVENVANQKLTLTHIIDPSEES